jgi:hypothetical protein
MVFLNPKARRSIALSVLGLLLATAPPYPSVLMVVTGTEKNGRPKPTGDVEGSNCSAAWAILFLREKSKWAINTSF